MRVVSYETNQIKYANSICFRPNDRRLYIADCYTYAREDSITNRICILDYDDIEKGIVEVIEPVRRGGIYSIGYDIENDVFYSTNYLGKTEGETNVIFAYNGIFESVKDEIVIDDLTVRNRPFYETMGVQCVKDNVAYVLYSYPDYVVTGYDLETGNLVLNYIVPNKTSDSEKAVIRPETIIYNVDINEILIQTTTGIVRCE